METIGLFESLFLILGPVFTLLLFAGVLVLFARFLFLSRVDDDGGPEA